MAPGQRGCGLNPEGRWPERIQQSMGRGLGGQVLYEPAVGVNGLRPNEYIQNDPDTGQSTGQVSGPYGPNPLTGDHGGSGAWGQEPYVSDLPVVNPNTGKSFSNPYPTPPPVPEFTPRDLGNKYHNYDINGIQSDYEKSMQSYAKAMGLDLGSIGV